MKATLNNLMKETALNDVSERGTLPLLLAVLMKYGIAPLVCFYLAWANYHKDENSQRNTDKMIILVEAQTAATVKNTEVLGQLKMVVEKNNEKFDKFERNK